MLFDDSLGSIENAAREGARDVRSEVRFVVRVQFEIFLTGIAEVIVGHVLLLLL